MTSVDSIQATINGIRTQDDYRLACVLVRNRIRGGAEIDSGHILSLAAKGHLLQAQEGSEISEEFMATLGTEPATMV